VDQILSMSDREVTANRSRCGVLRIRSSHKSTHDLPGVLGTLDNEDQCGTLRDEFDELVVIRLTLVLDVMTLSCREVNRTKIARDDAQLLGFEATNDLADEAACHTVGFHDEKRSIHDEAI